MKLTRITSQKTTLNKFAIFLIPVFLITLADTVISFTFPLIVESEVNSNTVMGLIISMAALSGIVMDIIIPKIFPGKAWKNLILTGLALSMFFGVFVYASEHSMTIPFLILASIIWGGYWEFIVFSEQDFIITEESKKNFVRDWGIIDSSIFLAIIIGPIFAATLLKSEGVDNFLLVVLLLQVIAFTVTLIAFRKSRGVDIRLHSKVSIVNELKKIAKLFPKVSEIFSVAFSINFINSAFWTVGALLSFEIASESDLPNWSIMFVYGVCLLFSSLVTSTTGLKKHRENFAIVSLLLATLIFSTFAFVDNNFVLLGLFALGVLFIAPAHIHNEAALSRVEEGNKKDELALAGIYRMSFSFAYIFSPVLTGFLSDQVGYKDALSYISFIFFALMVLLLVKKSLLKA